MTAYASTKTAWVQASSVKSFLAGARGGYQNQDYSDKPSYIDLRYGLLLHAFLKMFLCRQGVFYLMQPFCNFLNLIFVLNPYLFFQNTGGNNF